MSQTEVKAALAALGGYATGPQLTNKLREMYPATTVSTHWYREMRQLRAWGEVRRDKRGSYGLTELGRVRLEPIAA